LQTIRPGTTLPRGPYNRISVSALHGRSAVLLGATDNQWTMRLTEQLPYHFVEDGTAVRIVDAKNPTNREWTVDYSRPYAEVRRDHALVVRYHDRTTGGEVLIVLASGPMRPTRPAFS